MARSNLRLIESDEPATSKRAPRRERTPLREVVPEVLWHAVVVAAILAGGAYVALCLYIVYGLWVGPRGSYDMLAVGLALVVTLWGAAAIVQRLRRPVVITEVVEQVVRVYHQNDDPPR